MTFPPRPDPMQPPPTSPITGCRRESRPRTRGAETACGNARVDPRRRALGRVRSRLSPAFTRTAGCGNVGDCWAAVRASLEKVEEAIGKKAARIAVAAMLAVMMEEVHQRAGQYQQVGKRAEDVSGVPGQQKETGDEQETDEGNVRPRALPARLDVVLHGSGPLLPNFSGGKVVEGSEHKGDVPSPYCALDEAEEEAGPTEKREAWQEDTERGVRNSHVRQQQIAKYANDVGDDKERAQGHAESHDGDPARSWCRVKGVTYANGGFSDGIRSGAPLPII